MVTIGLFAPRTWSASVIGGNTDGTSGPGVGAARIVVQEGGVGIMMLIAGLGVRLTEGKKVGVDVVAQAERIKERKKMTERVILI